MRHKVLSFILPLCVLSTSQTTLAENDLETIQEKNKNNTLWLYVQNSWFATGSIGPLWQSNGKTQTFIVAPNVVKTYAANNNTEVITGLSINLGVQKPFKNRLERFKWQLGGVLENAASATLTGEIWDDADPQFNNYTYRYSVKHTRVAAKGKLLYDGKYKLQPWISGSLGIGWNYAENYQNFPRIFPAVVNTNFVPHTTQALTYSIGAGVQRIISKSIQIGLAYEFTDWGGSTFAKPARQVTYNVIQTQHFYTNGLLANITYLAGKE